MSSRRSRLTTTNKVKHSVVSRGKRSRKSFYAGKEKSRTSRSKTSRTSSVHSPSNTSISSRELLGIEIFDVSKDLWIERSKFNIGVFKAVPYEYNIFDDTGHRILFVMPTIGTETLGGGEKPNVFSVLTCMGRDICDIKYAEVKCCNRVVTLEVRVDDEPFGIIQQAHQDFLLMDADTHLLLKAILVSKQGGALCSKRPTQFVWEVFHADDLTAAVGRVGRNGNKLEEVILGQPRAFYYQSTRVKDENPEKTFHPIDSTHKLLIASLLVGLMVTYSDLA